MKRKSPAETRAKNTPQKDANIQIHTPSGNHLLSFYTPRPIRVTDIKKHITKKTDVPRFRQRLVHNLQILQDQQRISPPANLQLVTLNPVPSTIKSTQELVEACFEDHESEVEDLLHLPVDVNAQLPRQSANDRANGAVTALQAAANANNPEILTLLIEARAELHTKANQLALWHAASTDSEEAATLLIHHRANLNATDHTGTTPLMIAAENGHTSTVKLLLARKANHSSKDSQSSTALFTASSTGNCKITCLLLEAKAKIERPSDPSTVAAATMLHAAASLNDVHAMALLLESRVHVDARTNATALWYAAWEGHEAALLLLLQQRSNPNANTKHGGTALCAAAFQGQSTIAEHLIRAKANIEHRSERNEPPLQQALWGNQASTAQILLNARAQPANIAQNELPIQRLLRRAQNPWALHVLLPQADLHDRLQLYKCLQLTPPQQ